jgi:hypothetical protein
MTNKDLISELSEEQVEKLLKYAPAYSEQNLANIKAQTLNKLNSKENPIVKKSFFGRLSAAAVAAVIAGVTLLSVVAVAAGPTIVENISRIISIVNPTHVIDDTERNISFEMELNRWLEYEAQPHHITFEDAGVIASEAIYEEFGFSLDGMVGYATFMGSNLGERPELWSGVIVDEYLTRHSDNDILFHFLIDAITGEVIYLAMNTPETPFHG